MKQASHINYTKDFYACDKPYRASLIAAMKHYGYSHIKQGQEFWTLGAKEWHEYHYLTKNGLTFEPKTYHNVDIEQLDPPPDQNTIAHPKTNFFDIHRIWTNPIAICFDSTEGLVDSRQNNWGLLVEMAATAAKLSSKVVLTWNYMTTYGNLPLRNAGEIDEILTRYTNWLAILEDNCLCEGLEIDFYKEGVCEPKENTPTLMLCGHALITS